MAYQRRAHKRGGRRRFFRRRSSFKPTTQSGSGRLARCHINQYQSADISTLSNTMVGNYRRIAGMQSMSTPWGAGLDTRELATMLTMPLKGFDVKGLRLDVDVFCGQDEPVPVQSGNVFIPPTETTFQWGFLVMTQRENDDGLPNSGEFPNMAMSQWPLNTDADEFDITEDQDYATRIHYQKSGFLRPNQVPTSPDVDGPVWPVLQGRPHTHFSCRIPISRRIPDGYGLYFGFWTLTPVTWTVSILETCEFSVMGDLWYKLSR